MQILSTFTHIHYNNMIKQHHYTLQLQWTGNDGVGTRDYRAYRRDHTIQAAGKPELPASSDPAFRGDPARYNPEELLVASLASCHMLWFLHLCADAGIIVVDYQDNPKGVMQETADEGGHFTEVILYPTVIVAHPDQVEIARKLHEKAHKWCFIANSCNFPVHHEDTCTSV
jgi:organic hydroperoxide reductase OsmC/OhrA